MDESQPTRLERFVVDSVLALQRVGLGELIQSAVLRGLAKRLLLRADSPPRLRAIASGVGRGLKLQVLDGTPKSYWMGTHELTTQALLLDQIKSGMTVYDCGANIGYFSVIFARLVGPAGRIFAFEPSPDSLQCLHVAREINGLNNLTVVPQAVWDRKEMLYFVRSAPDASSVSDHVEGVFGKSSEQKEHIEVPAISLDELVYKQGNPPPDFIKIDVEGSEGEAVAGACRLLSECRPSLLLEIHGAPGRRVWQFLKELNYVATNVATGEVPRTVDEFAIWKRQYLAVPA